VKLSLNCSAALNANFLVVTVVVIISIYQELVVEM
jgi:hypothetical protein